MFEKWDLAYISSSRKLNTNDKKKDFAVRWCLSELRLHFSILFFFFFFRMLLCVASTFYFSISFLDRKNNTRWTLRPCRLSALQVRLRVSVHTTHQHTYTEHLFSPLVRNYIYLWRRRRFKKKNRQKRSTYMLTRNILFPLIGIGRAGERRTRKRNKSE